MCKIKINDNIYQGDSIEVINGKVVIDDKDVTPDSKEINIYVEGNVEILEVVACNKISVVGDVKTISAQSGDIHVTGNIEGAISTKSGNVRCSKVQGAISTTTGNVGCGNVECSLSRGLAV